MRTFYIFKINKLLNSIYGKKSVSLFKLLSKINDLDIKEYKMAKRMYKNIILKIDKKGIDNYLLMNHINDYYYTKSGNRHVLKSDLELSNLFIYNTYIKIETTKNISSFIKDIISYDSNFFVVDFKNKDYFYLSDLKENILAS